MPTNEYRDTSADTTLDSAVVNTEQTELEQLRIELANAKEYTRRLQKQMSESSLYNVIVQLNELRLDVIELRKMVSCLVKNEPAR